MTIPDLTPLHSPSGEPQSNERALLQGLWKHAMCRYEETHATVSTFDPTEQPPEQLEESIQFYYFLAPELAAIHDIPQLLDHPKRVVCFENRLLSVVGSDEDHPVVSACAELLNNCTDKGATYVYVYCVEGLLVVIDDVEHQPEEISAILERLNAPTVATTKPIGECGIASIRRNFCGRHTKLTRRGNLRYSTDGKRIIAILNWEE